MGAESPPKLTQNQNLFQKIYFYNFLSQIFWSSSEIFVPKPSNEVAFIGYIELVKFALINIQNGERGGGDRYIRCNYICNLGMSSQDGHLRISVLLP